MTIAKQTPFLPVFKHHPEEIMIVANPEVFEELENVCTIAKEDKPLVFYYDTTFNLANAYVSTLSFGHPFIGVRDSNFDSSVNTPLAYLIHKKRTKKIHEDFFANVNDLLKINSKNKSKIIVCDRKFDHFDMLYNSEVVYCWNHLRRKV